MAKRSVESEPETDLGKPARALERKRSAANANLGLATGAGRRRVLAAQHVEKLLATCIASARDQCDALRSQLLAQPERGCERRRAGRLDEVARRVDHQRLRRANLVIADENEVVEPLPEDPLWELERGACGEALGERLHAVLD